MTLRGGAWVAALAFMLASVETAAKPDYGPADLPQVEAELRKAILLPHEPLALAVRASAVFAEPPHGIFAVTAQRVLYAVWERKPGAYALKLSQRWESVACAGAEAGDGRVSLYHADGRTTSFLLKTASGGADEPSAARALELIDAHAPYVEATCPNVRASGPYRHPPSGIVIAQQSGQLERSALVHDPATGAMRARYRSTARYGPWFADLLITSHEGAALLEDAERLAANQREAEARYSMGALEPGSARLFGESVPAVRVRLHGHNVVPDKIDSVLVHHGAWRIQASASWAGETRGRAELLDGLLGSLVLESAHAAASALPAPASP